MRHFFITACAMAMVGCATSGPATFERVQVFQSADPALSCEQLHQGIVLIESALVELDKKLDSLNEGSGMLAASAMTGPLTAMFAPLASKMHDNAIEKGKVARDTRQQRRDVLMRQFYAKKCSTS